MINSGFIIIKKPIGPTSHDIIDRLRHITGKKRIGHAGTLDPFASGVLIIGIGRSATREFSKLVGLPKKYSGTLKLGGYSDTDDRTGQIINKPLNNKIEESDIHSTLKKYTGKITQIPPMYSAKKINGKKLYKLAREGKTIERQPIEIEIYSLTAENLPVSLETNTLLINVHSSSGTYIRTLAHDIGETLGCGAYLEKLERTAVGPFDISLAIDLNVLDSKNWTNFLILTSEVVDRCQ